MKIFIVENHEDTLTYLSRYLQMRGHVVESATDMRGALAALVASAPDVLISDIGLPDGDGWELLRRVREMNLAPFSIAMSGFGMGSDREKSRLAGYKHHLIKPFLPEDLDAVLEEAASAAAAKS